jgi:hypothetical protein
MRMRLKGPAGLLPGWLEADGGILVLRTAERRWVSVIQRFPNGESNIAASFEVLARRAAEDDHLVIACGTCKHFGFTGLSFQFSGGSIGYCSLVGRRDKDATVAVGFGCGEYYPAPDWQDAGDYTRRSTDIRRVIDAPHSGALLRLLPAGNRGNTRGRLHVGQAPCSGGGINRMDCWSTSYRFA